MTPYEVLGVDPRSPDAEIRRAYLALARRFHPDVHPGGETRMQAVNEAWAILGDRARRAAWDRDHVDPGFRPDHPDGDGDGDPREQPDVPYRPVSPQRAQRHSLLSVAPVATFAASVGSFGGGVFFDNAGLLGLGVVLFSAACATLVVVLLTALVAARRDEG